MKKFQRIGLFSSISAPEVKDSLRRLELFLTAQGCDVIYEEQTANLINWDVANRLRINEFSGAVDMTVVVGGDGSMLTASREMAACDIPLLGINRGRLGFLTDILPEELEPRVASVLAGDYKLTKRFMLETSITRDNELLDSNCALNDVVLHPGKSVRMMEFEFYVDDRFVYSQRSDGLIVATPTGSTAYALSAGGPLLVPELDAVVVVPLNPHTLSSRPIALHGNAKIEIRVGSRNKLHPVITCDGHNDFMTEPGDMICIQKYAHEIQLIHPSDHNYYSICRSKLGWGSRLGVEPKAEQ